MPANIEAERALLGAILANNAAFDRVAGFLEPSHFADLVNGRIFAAISERVLSGTKCDAVTLKTVFEGAGDLDEIGGSAYLAHLLASMVAITSAGEYGRAVQDAWLRRQLINLGEDLVNSAFGGDPDLSASGLVTMVENSLAALGSGGRKGDVLSTVGQLVSRAMAAAGEIFRGTPVARLLTGVPTLDRAVRLRPSSFTLLAGPPSAGKTGLAVQLSVSIAKARAAQAVANGWAPADAARLPGVAIFSLEMSSDELGERIAAAEAEIDLEHLLDGRLDMISSANLARAESSLRHVPLRVWDCTATPLRLLGRKIRMHLARQPELLIVVDHLLVTGEDDETRRRDQQTMSVAQLASGFKGLAKETGLPFIVLTHTARPPKATAVQRPVLTDIKYAGEGVADNVIFVHRPILFMDKSPPEQGKLGDHAFNGIGGVLDKWHKRMDDAKDLAEIIVAKQRQGKTGLYRMKFHGPTTSFREWNETAAQEAPDWVTE
jgi:replicative DNA helicase